MSQKPCCDDFVRALSPGTDGKAHAPLITARPVMTAHPSTYEIGIGLPPVAYCPWCGHEMSMTKERVDEIVAHSLSNPALIRDDAG